MLTQSCSVGGTLAEIACWLVAEAVVILTTRQLVHFDISVLSILMALLRLKFFGLAMKKDTTESTNRRIRL